LTNFGASPTRVELDIGSESDVCDLADLFGRGEFALSAGTVTVELERYGSRWLRVLRPGQILLL
jgi:hypothetical protein